jgi:transcriptional repressor NrdR
MRCPNCGTLDGRVIDSRDLDDSTTVRRRRECSACRTRYTTYERVESPRLVVVKRDGVRQEFDREKLAAGLAKALHRRPVGPDAAEEAADVIEAALRSQGMTEVPSSRIGQMAMDQLRELDHIAFIRFLSVYQSFEDLEQLKREVDALYAERTERVPGQTTLRLVDEESVMLPLVTREGRVAAVPRRRPTRHR